jgi:hydrogenase maturation protein HypF
MKAAKLLVKGQVQGLGFRPYVYRLARKLNLKGTVSNTRSGVEIVVQGAKVKEFVATLKSAPPALARIARIEVRAAHLANFKAFSIMGTRSESRPGRAVGKVRDLTPVLDVLPDIATCPACREDLSDPENRRLRYPFTNCTQCGPRYSIVLSLPYDRPRTTMKEFRMCPACQREYDDPANRRFHAQPNCCPVCGPKFALLHANGNSFDDRNPIETAVKLLLDGRILAIKSLGGFHVACDATNEAAVAELRRRKDRPDKPLAIMCRSLDMVRRFSRTDVVSSSLLADLARPIVLLAKKPDASEIAVSPIVAPATGYWGVMLAYAPIHHLLFRPTDTGAALRALVMTSANPKDEPVISELEELIARLGSVVDYVLTNDRPIANRCDDSVLFVSQIPNPKVRRHAQSPAPIFVRRSKGYAPSPVVLNPKSFQIKPVLACGGEMKNTFALAAGNRVYLSPHIGDVNSARGMEFFAQTLDVYRKWYQIVPEAVACDLHPDFMTTRFAENLALKSHRPLVRVQHHHAHIVSVMAEHNLREPVLGIALDGTGLGTDQKIWGCEILLARRAGFERLGHLRYLPLIGGEAVISEPKRIAAGYLIYLFGEQVLSSIPGLTRYRDLLAQLNLGTNVVFTSSTGRLFDAVSGLLGICPHASFDGQAPAQLEAAAESGPPNIARERRSYFDESDLTTSAACQIVIDPKRWLEQAVADIGSGLAAGRISKRFHNTFIAALTAACRTAARQCRVRDVCLSGGSFQNRLLLRGLAAALSAARFKVHTNHLVPVNDGGISLGQAVIADAFLRSQRKPKPQARARNSRR